MSLKYEWRDDPELCVMLMDSCPAPKAVTGPRFYSQYRFVIKRTDKVEVKPFVPGWAFSVVCNMLDNDPDVQRYTYEKTYKGKEK